MAAIIIISILALGAISWIITFLVMKYVVRKNIVVIPNGRSLHDMPVPKGGGIGLVISWYIGITILFLTDLIDKSLYFALLSGILIAIVSFIDDFKGLKPAIRLVIHFAAAILAFWVLGGLRPLVLPEIKINYDYITWPLAIIGMVWFINLFNFMDGVDGFASLEAIFICGVLFIMSWNLVNILLIACVAGFLYWNWPKARIFMGDIGSTQLGFILVVLGIYFHNHLEFSILNWIMLTSPFWFDATLTLLRRWRNGEKLSEAHRKHAYQRIVQAGFSHEKVNIYLMLVNTIIIIFVILYRQFKILQIPLFILTLILFYLAVRRIDSKVPFTKDSEHS